MKPWGNKTQYYMYHIYTLQVRQLVLKAIYLGISDLLKWYAEAPYPVLSTSPGCLWLPFVMMMILRCKTALSWKIGWLVVIFN